MASLLLLLLVSTLAGYCVHAGTSFPRPVGFWMFDRKDEGKDLSGNGNDAVLYNTEWTSGPFGTSSNAVTFTGADDQSSRAEIPNTNRALTVTDSFTWLTYFKDLNSAKAGPIFALANSNAWGHIFFKCCSGADAFHPRFDVPHNGPAGWSKSFPSFFPQDTWMQVAVTYDQPNGVIRIYQYGEERTDIRGSYSTLLDDDWDQVFLGAMPGDGRELHAAIFCQMYFDVALTREQLSTAFSMCRPNEARSLYPWPTAIAHWPMNSYYEARNAADGLAKDGISRYHLIVDGPHGEKGGAFQYRPIGSSYTNINNSMGKLDVNSFTFSTWIKPEARTGYIFRIWADLDGADGAPYISQYPTSTQIHYAHFSQTDGQLAGTVTSNVGSLPEGMWSYIAVVYDYGEGNAHIYINGALEATANIGSHVTKMGPMFSLAETQVDDFSTETSMSLACVQWYGDPLSLESLSITQEECNLARKSYRADPTWIYSLNKWKAFNDNREGYQQIIPSAEVSYVQGSRSRPNEAMQLATNSTLSLPNMREKFNESFTISVHIKMDSAADISLLDDGLSLTQTDLYVRSEDTEIKFKNLTAGVADTFVWLGVTYNYGLGTITVYLDGNPVAVKFVGAHTLTISDSPNITNRGSPVAIECYQIYNTALNLREFVHTRDACIKYYNRISLPYPRAFWPLNRKYTYKEVTGRAYDLIPLDSDAVEFSETGPYGGDNSVAYLDGNNINSTLYSLPNRAMDSKFSLSITAWVKCHRTFDERSSNVFIMKAQTSAEQNIYGHSGVKLVINSDINGLYFSTIFGSTNSDITVPEHADYQSYQSQYFQREQWTHVTAVYNFEAKTASVYMNGSLVESKMMNRHILKTFYMLMVGGEVRFNPDAYAYKPNKTNGNNAITCLQMYDVALNAEQILRTMELCNDNVLTSWYSSSRIVSKGLSYKNPDRTFQTSSQLRCADFCQRDEICTAFAFGNSECQLIDQSTSEFTEDDFINTGYTYMEKDTCPWKLFV